jgi:hypothetical protein
MLTAFSQPLFMCGRWLFVLPVVCVVCNLVCVLCVWLCVCVLLCVQVQACCCVLIYYRLPLATTHGVHVLVRRVRGRCVLRVAHAACAVARVLML